MIRANFIPIAVRNDYSEMDTDATWGHKEHSKCLQREANLN